MATYENLGTSFSVNKSVVTIKICQSLTFLYFGDLECRIYPSISCHMYHFQKLNHHILNLFIRGYLYGYFSSI